MRSATRRVPGPVSKEESNDNELRGRREMDVIAIVSSSCRKPTSNKETLMTKLKRFAFTLFWVALGVLSGCGPDNSGHYDCPPSCRCPPPPDLGPRLDCGEGLADAAD